MVEQTRNSVDEATRTARRRRKRASGEFPGPNSQIAGEIPSRVLKNGR